MASIDSLETLLTHELRDLLDVEHRLTKTLPKLAKASNNDELRSAFTEHLGQTEQHVTRVEKALKVLGAPVKAKTCPGIRGIIDEGSEMMGEDFGDDSLKDAALIGGAQRAEHYEIAAYGTVLAFARQLGRDQNRHAAAALTRGGEGCGRDADTDCRAHRQRRRRRRRPKSRQDGGGARLPPEQPRDRPADRQRAGRAGALTPGDPGRPATR